MAGLDLKTQLHMCTTIMEKCNNFMMDDRHGPIDIKDLKDALITFRLARRTYYDTLALMSAEMKAAEDHNEENKPGLPVIK